MPDLLWGEQRNVVDELIQYLDGPRCAALLGEYRMGKTTALDGLLSRLQPPRAYVSVAKIIAENPQPTDVHLYRALLEALVRDLPSGLPPGLSMEPPATAQSDAGRVRWFADTVKRLADLQVTLLIDDADQLEGVKWGAGVLRGLKLLFSNVPNVPQVRILLAGTGKLAKWGDELQRRGKGAGLWDSLASLQVQLSALSPALIRDELRQHPQLAEQLIVLCGGHPFCLKRLTQDLALITGSTKHLVEEVNLKARQLAEVWDETFRACWPSLDLIGRRVCFVLASLQGRITLETVQDRVKDVSPSEVKITIQALKDMGLLYEETDPPSLHLIGLFLEWYKQEIGFVEGLRSAATSPPVEPVVISRDRPCAEFTFLAEQDLVLIRRDRFLSLSELGIKPDRLRMLIRRTRQAVIVENESAFEDLQSLSSELWDRVQQTSWYKEVCRAVESKQPLRFDIPKVVGEFPFELLPLDEDGLRRVGTQVPLSRRLISQGRDIQRLPLTLPRESQERLRVLVVAPDVGGTISIDLSGHIYQGAEADISAGQKITLDALSLRGEVRALWDIFAAQADLIQEVVFLTDETINVQSGSALRIFREPPTADAFRRLLRAPDQQFDVLHFVGHGLTVADSPMMGGLVFGDSLIHLTELESLLRNQQRLAFVYLSCCESATLASDPRTSGLVGRSARHLP